METLTGRRGFLAGMAALPQFDSDGRETLPAIRSADFALYRA